jgi:complement component 1 Q subcomponent-binding protein
LGPQGDFERAESYGGPDYEQLQPELRDSFLAFMSERGFDEALAEFIPAFLEVKEQGEYVGWLKKVKDFVQE